MKKVLALALVLVFALSMTAVAFAAPVKGSITIKDSATVQVAGKTFDAYKILDATLVDPADAKKGISYTVPEALKDFYADRYTISKTAEDFDEQVVAKVAAEPDKFDFAAAALAAAKAAKIVPASATAGSETSVTIDNLAIGYYVVEDKGAATPISALILDTTTPNVEIAIKAGKPTIDKKIDGDKDTDPSTSGKVDMNNASIGDKVPYVLTSKVPDMTGYKKYFFVVNDTLSKGLKFNNDVAITVDGVKLGKNDFSVEVTELADGKTAVKIIFKDFYNKYHDKVNAPIIITYSATLDDDAVIGTEGNPNEVYLEYSHNPNITPEGTPENPDKPGPGDKDVIGETPKSVTKTFVTGIEILKVNKDDERLAGAEFEITGTRINRVLVKTQDYVESKEGTFYLLKDGTYTEEVPTEETKDQYANTAVKYVYGEKTTVVETTEDVHCKAVTGKDGIIRFDGLGAGDYVIKEIKAPDGYNLIKKPIKITIKCELPETVEGKCKWTAVGDATVLPDGRIQLKVLNKTGIELPSTGGMGTTILYVVGGLLVVGAAVLLFVKKRTATEK